MTDIPAGRKDGGNGGFRTCDSVYGCGCGQPHDCPVPPLSGPPPGWPRDGEDCWFWCPACTAESDQAYAGVMEDWLKWRGAQLS